MSSARAPARRRRSDGERTRRTILETASRLATVEGLEGLSLGAEVNGGFERNTFGTSAWMAGALYARARLFPILFVAARGDVFWERDAENALGRASPTSFPVEWVASPTLTLDLRPVDHVSARLELRHDHAASDLFFGGTVAGDGVTIPYVPNRPSQDTLTLGMTTWF